MTPASPPPTSPDSDQPYVPLWLREQTLDDGPGPRSARARTAERGSTPPGNRMATSGSRPERGRPKHAKRSATGTLLRRPGRMVAALLAVAVTGLGIRACAITSGDDTTSADAGGPTETSSTSSIPSVAALPVKNASVRLLVGGPDAMGNGGEATRALLRRPTGLARLGAGLLVADAGGLRLIRGDGVIGQVVLPPSATGFRVDHVGVLSGRNVLAADEQTGALLRLDDVGSDVLSATAVPSPGLITPAAVAGDGRGAAFVADPGSGIVWRWTEASGLTPFVRGGVAPVGVAALVGGGALVADRGSGMVFRVDDTGASTPIAATADAAKGIAEQVVRLPSVPVDVAWDGGSRVLVLLADSTLVSVPLNPTGRESPLLITEFLRGPVAVIADDDGPLVVEAGERRVVRVAKDANGTLVPQPVAGAVSWPGFSPKALRAADVVLIDPSGVATTPDGSAIVADRGANVVWRLDPDGKATRLAGTDSWGSTGNNDDASASALAGPTDVAVTADGTVVVTESFPGRVRTISPSGALGSLTPSGSAVTPVAVGPVVALGSTVLVGDRYRGGLAPFASGRATEVEPSATVAPGTRVVFAAPAKGGGAIAATAAGTFLRIADNGSVTSASLKLPAGTTVRAGAVLPDDTVLVALGGRGKGITQTVDSLRVDARSALGGRDGNDIAALAPGSNGVLLAASGDRAAVSVVDLTSDATQAEPLTSTALGPDQGRPNETPLTDPVSVDAPKDGSVVVADRGGARVRTLRNGLVSTVAGSGRIGVRIDPKATATNRSLPDLRDARVRRNGLLMVADGDALLEIDGMGYVQTVPLPRRDGKTVRLRSVDEAFDGSIVAVDTDGRLLRLGDGPANVLSSTPPLARVHVDAKGALWAITEDGRLVRFRSSSFVPISMPRDLKVAGFDERDGRIVVVGTGGEVVESVEGSWSRLLPTTAVAADRRTTNPAPAAPTDVAILSDGAVVVADAGRDALLVYRTR